MSNVKADIGMPAIEYRFEGNDQITPCIKALLNGIPLKSGEDLPKNASGTLEVEDESENRVFFNLVLKTRTSKPNDPPIYLRFTKVDRIDVNKVLEYAKIGDEIYVEPYNPEGFTCAPSRFVVN